MLPPSGRNWKLICPNCMTDCVSITLKALAAVSRVFAADHNMRLCKCALVMKTVERRLCLIMIACQGFYCQHFRDKD